MCPANLTDSFLLESILAERCVCHQEGPRVRMIDWKQPENSLHHHKSQVSHMAEQFWVPLPCCSLPGCPFPTKSLALSARVSSDSSFLSVRKEPSLGLWKGSPFPATIA